MRNIALSDLDPKARRAAGRSRFDSRPRRGVHVCLILALCVAAGALGRNLSAATITWDGDTSTDFANGANWIGNAAPANNTTTDIGLFGPTVTANQPTLTASRSITGLVFQSATGGWTLGGTGFPLSIGASGIDDTANTGGTTTISTGTVTLAATQTWSSGVGGNLSVPGTTLLNGNRTLTVNSGVVTLATMNADTTGRTFNKLGNGTLAITGAAGANLQGSFSLGGGTLILGNNAALGTGIFRYNVGSLRATQDLVIANTFDYATQGSGAGSGSNSISGSNNITFSGLTRVSFETASNATRTLHNDLATGKTLTFSGDVYLAQAATVARTLTLSGSGATTFSGNISNFGTSGSTGAITITNTGLTTFSGNNTYTGATTVSNGTLLVNGNQSSATGNVSVALAAVLGGTGTVGGAATVSGGIAPGSGGIGTLSLLAGVTWNSGTAWRFELGSPAANLAAATASTNNDRLAVTGAFTKGTGSSFTFNFANTGLPGWYRLVDYDSTTFTTGSSSQFTATGLPSGNTANFVVDAGSTALYVEIVPEPGTLALATLGIASAAWCARRRRGRSL
jgi:autotransporter-associated beta strand protein